MIRSSRIFSAGSVFVTNGATIRCNRKRDDEWRIRAGEWDTETKDERLPHQDRRVQDIIAHEQHIPGVLFYDFAILILSEPVELAENVDIVCLPDQDFVFDGSRCLASGWGKDKCGTCRLLSHNNSK